MVYVETWDDFAEKAELLFRQNPENFRYSMKYRHKEGRLVLKATDNRVCVMLRTDQATDAKKMEKLNTLFFTLMARGLDAPLADEEMAEASTSNATAARPASTKRGRGKRQ